MARAPIGGRVTVHLGEQLLAWIDDYATTLELPRAALIRLVLTQFGVERSRARGIDVPNVLVDGLPTVHVRGITARVRGEYL